jgi:uroporphyrinogen-III synthase
MTCLIESVPVKPLANRRILITRAPNQASELAERVRALGGTPILIPTIEIGPPTSWDGLDEAIGRLDSFDLVAFTSANAVEAFCSRASLAGVSDTPKRVAVVGSATAKAAEAGGMSVAVVPPVFTAESLAETLAPEANGQRILLVLAEVAPTVLHDRLQAAGAAITVAAAYKNRIPQQSLKEVASLFGSEANYPDAIIFTSASTATNLVALLKAAGLGLPPSIPRASIGPITSRALRDLELPAHMEAAESTIAGLVTCLAAHFRPDA